MSIQKAGTTYRILNKYKGRLPPSQKPSFGEIGNQAGHVILITGGSGFLGQHIIKLLQEKKSVESIKEIRVFDTKQYRNKLDHPLSIPIRSCIGDVCDTTALLDSLRGVNTVFHVAGLISFGTFPDYDAMEKINVTGTKNVIECSIKCDVRRIIFTSTVDVVVGFQDIFNGNEDLQTPTKFLFPGYPESKRKAEDIVLAANGSILSNGKKLTTVSLRPNVMYGEEDPYYVTNALRNASFYGKKLTRVGSGVAKFQQSYVGNVAWAHIKAMETLQSLVSTEDELPSSDETLSSGLGLNQLTQANMYRRSRSEVTQCKSEVTQFDKVAGKAYFVPDDTPPTNTFDFMKPYLEANSMTISRYYIPYTFGYLVMYLTESVILLLKPFVKINLQTPLCSIIYINRTIYFSGDRARCLLKYTPLFNPAECRNRSLKYYKKLVF